MLAVLLAGCGSMPESAEMAREVVLQHVGGDARTAGPFKKKSMQELETLSGKDRSEAVALFERGAVAFLVFTAETGTPPPGSEGKAADPIAASRIVFVQHGKIVGDFHAAKKQATEPAR